MKDSEKTKEQLLYELTGSRSQNEVLKKSESPEKYRSLVENLRDVTYELDSQGVVLYISPAVRELLGYDSAEIVGKNFIELAHKDDLSSRAEWFSELRKGLDAPSEFRITHKSGEYKWARTRVRPVIEDGQFKGARGILIDITEQKRAEKMLRESEESLRSYLEYAPDGVYMSDMKGAFLYGNRKCEEIIGYRREELIGKNFLEVNILPEKSLNKAAELFQASISGKSTGPDELELISKEGRIIPVEVSTSVVQQMGQRIVLAFVRDITDRKRTEEALRESEEKYRWVLNNMADVITVMDMNLRFTYVSPSIIRMRGYTVEETVAQTLEQVMTPESLQISVRVFEEEMKLEASGTADPGRIRIVELEQYRKDGSIVLIESHMSFMRDEARKAVGIISVSRDVTARKQMEEALRESEEWYRTLVENANDIVFRLDNTGHITFVNPAALSITGYEAKELIGSHYQTFIRPDMQEEAIKFFGRQFVKRIPNTYSEYPVIAKDGREIWLGQNTQLICRDDKVVAFQSVARDITESRRIGEALQDSKDRYRELSIIDDLTRLYNSRYFYHHLKIEMDRADRYEQPLTLLFFDLDDFKRFNDAYGHVEGDQVLLRLGQVVKKCLRETDFAFRYGGEEFTVLLPMTPGAEGAVTAERIRTEFRKETFSPAPDQDVHVTVSIGLAQYKPQEEMKAFVHRVDQLMYHGKKSGKDRVCYES